MEIIVIRRGQLAWQTEDVKEWVTPGTVYFTLPGQIHGSEHEFEPGHEWVFAVISASLDKNKKLRFHPDLPVPLRMQSSRVPCFARAWRVSLRTGARSPASRDVPSCKNRDSGRRRRDRARPHVAAGKSVEPVHVRPATENRVLAVIEKLRKRPGEKWTLPQLAGDCRLERSRFSTLFLRLTGDTLIRFLNRIRVHQACRMLRETDAPITRIALECGFESGQYFARVFKQFTGCLDARTYRKRGQRPPQRHLRTS